MKIEPKLIIRPNEVANRLEQLGVTKELLLDVVAAAVAGRNSCTNNDPLSAPGWRSWCDGVRRLRERLFEADAGWMWDEAENIPSALNLELKVKITVCNTDFGTGLKQYQPQQMAKKGSATDRIIGENRDFFHMLENTKNLVPLKLAGGISCWYLCVYCEGEDVRAELSCPVRCEDGFFKDFHERIILISDNDDSTGVMVRKKGSDDGDSELEIPVKRKRAL